MSAKNESALRDRLWPEAKPELPSAPNPYWNDLPLSYRLWPDETWPPQLDGFSGPAVQSEEDRLFAKFYEQEKDNWD